MGLTTAPLIIGRNVGVFEMVCAVQNLLGTLKKNIPKMNYLLVSMETACNTTKIIQKLSLLKYLKERLCKST